MQDMATQWQRLEQLARKAQQNPADPEHMAALLDAVTAINKAYLDTQD